MRNINIWRLNVKDTQIGECILNKLFAIETRPRNPEIKKGDILLLHLVSTDAKKQGKENARVEYALIFDHYEEDYNGIISNHYWPRAGKTWRWILHCSGIITTAPFSLENLNLSNDYAGQINPKHIKPEDIDKILPFILSYGETEEIGPKVHRVLEESASRDFCGMSSNSLFLSATIVSDFLRSDVSTQKSIFKSGGFALT